MLPCFDLQVRLKGWIRILLQKDRQSILVNTPITRLLGADVEIKMSKGGGLLC